MSPGIIAAIINIIIAAFLVDRTNKYMNSEGVSAPVQAIICIAVGVGTFILLTMLEVPIFQMIAGEM